jgi:hypothetical protein
MKAICSLLRFLAGFWWLGCVVCQAALPAADADVCAVCGQPITDVYYGFEDQVTHQKSHVCRNCEQSYPACFICGLPANTNLAGFVRLTDGRAICARDTKTAVVQPEEGLRICLEVRDGLDRLFSRFTSFPETNVTIGMVDRVQLLELLKLVGNDYHCPNVWGYTQIKTNRNHLEYRISLISGLPLGWFQATCAHEYAHTWLGDHLSPQRKETLNKDAEEGFCELVSFLYMDSLHDEAQKTLILGNGYTRGQIDLFIDAEGKFGFNEVLDWMQFGSAGRLSGNDPGRIRDVAFPARTNWPAFNLAVVRAAQAPAPDTLMLKGIFWDQKHPVALINDRAFALGEEGSVRVSTSNVLVRCLSISRDEVRLRVVGPDKEQTLKLKSE